MKIDDILAPYQYDVQNPPELAEAFEAELNWFGTKRQATIARFIVQPDARDFYIAWRLEGDDGAWLLLDGLGSLRLERIWDKNEITPEKLLHRIRSYTGKGAFCRLYFLPEYEKYVGVTSGVGTFYKWFDRNSRSFHFNENKLKRQLCSETKQIFDSVLADENSDAAFALRLSNSAGSEAQAMIFDLAGVEEYEAISKIVERLITVVLWTSNIQWNHEEHYIVHIPLWEQPLSLRASSRGFITPELTKRERHWIELVKCFGPLQIGEMHRKKHRALGDCATLIMFQFAAPTSHERIEAKLQLLEWAKATLPLEKYVEIEAPELQL